MKCSNCRRFPGGCPTPYTCETPLNDPETKVTRPPSVPVILLEIFAGMGILGVMVYFIVENVK